MKDDIKYSYDVKISNTSPIFQTGIIGHTFDNCGEIKIESKIFESYEDCQNQLSSLMGTLSLTEARLSKKNFIIASKINPTHAKEKIEDGEQWDKFCIVKVYIAEADELKQDKLIFNISANIKIDQRRINMIKSLAPMLEQ